MSWLKSREHAQVNEPVEVFSKLEGEIREFVRRDVSTTPPSAPPQQGNYACVNFVKISKVWVLGLRLIESSLAILGVLFCFPEMFVL
jgi:hypothetical protein